MKYTYIGGVLKDGFYRRIPNSATGNKRAQKKALGTLCFIRLSSAMHMETYFNGLFARDYLNYIYLTMDIRLN